MWFIMVGTAFFSVSLHASLNQKNQLFAKTLVLAQRAAYRQNTIDKCNTLTDITDAIKRKECALSIDVIRQKTDKQIFDKQAYGLGIGIYSPKYAKEFSCQAALYRLIQENDAFFDKRITADDLVTNLQKENKGFSRAQFPVDFPEKLIRNSFDAYARLYSGLISLDQIKIERLRKSIPIDLKISSRADYIGDLVELNDSSYLCVYRSWDGTCKHAEFQHETTKRKLTDPHSLADGRVYGFDFNQYQDNTRIVLAINKRVNCTGLMNILAIPISLQICEGLLLDSFASPSGLPPSDYPLSITKRSILYQKERLGHLHAYWICESFLVQSSFTPLTRDLEKSDIATDSSEDTFAISDGESINIFKSQQKIREFKLDLVNNVHVDRRKLFFTEGDKNLVLLYRNGLATLIKNDDSNTVKNLHTIGCIQDISAISGSENLFVVSLKDNPYPLVYLRQTEEWVQLKPGADKNKIDNSGEQRYVSKPTQQEPYYRKLISHPLLPIVYAARAKSIDVWNFAGEPRCIQTVDLDIKEDIRSLTADDEVKKIAVDTPSQIVVLDILKKQQ